MAGKTYLNRVKRAGADVAEDDSQGADDQDVGFFFEFMAHFAEIPLLIHQGLHLQPLFLFLCPFPPHRGRLQARSLHQAIDGLLGFGRGLKTRQLHHLAQEVDRIIHRDGFQMDDQVIKGGVPPVGAISIEGPFAPLFVILHDDLPGSGGGDTLPLHLFCHPGFQVTHNAHLENMGDILQEEMPK